MQPRFGFLDQDQRGAVGWPQVLVAIELKGGKGDSNAGLRFDALLDFDIVGLHVGASAHELMLQRALEQGRTLNARWQVRGFDAIAQLVGEGLGVAVLPAVVAERFSKLFPIVVRPLPNPAGGETEYEIVAGERRWRAAQMAGLATIPAVVRDIPDESAVAGHGLTLPSLGSHEVASRNTRASPDPLRRSRP